MRKITFNKAYKVNLIIYPKIFWVLAEGVPMAKEDESLLAYLLSGAECRNFVGFGGHALPQHTPVTKIRFENVQDREHYQRKVRPSLRQKDSVAAQGYFCDFISGYTNPAHVNEGIASVKRDPDVGFFSMGGSHPFALPDATGVEKHLIFWPGENSIIVHSWLEIDVNSRQTEEALRSGDPQNRVLFHALALQYPPFSTGMYSPLVAVRNAGSFNISFAPFSGFSQVKYDLLNWHELIGAERISRLALMLDMINGLDDLARGGAGPGCPEGFYAVHEEPKRAVAREIAALPVERLRDQFMKELLQAMGKEGPIPRGEYFVREEATRDDDTS